MKNLTKLSKNGIGISIVIVIAIAMLPLVVTLVAGNPFTAEVDAEAEVGVSSSSFSSSNRHLVQSTSSASSVTSSSDDGIAMTHHQRFLHRHRQWHRDHDIISNYLHDNDNDSVNVNGVAATNNRILYRGKDDSSCQLENNFFYRWSYQQKHTSNTPTTSTTTVITPTPWWFSYKEAFYKDFSSYIQETNDGRDIDYTSLLEHFRATCEISNGGSGIMYAISGSQSCITTTTDGDGMVTDTTTTTYSDVNLPICISSDCTSTIADMISSSSTMLKDSSVLNYCTKMMNEEGHDTATTTIATTATASASATGRVQTHERKEFSYQIEKVDSLIGDECKAELQSFNSKVGYGTPDYLWAMVELPKYCTQDSYDVETCDFQNATHDFLSDCEDDEEERGRGSGGGNGGILYTYSDYWHDDERNFTSFYLNQPLCIGKSCDVENYFEKFIFAHNTFDLSGTFFRTTSTTNDNGDGDGTTATVEVVGNITHEYYPISYHSAGGQSSSVQSTETEIESESWPIFVSSASRLPIAIGCGITLVLLIWFLYY